MPPFNWSHFLSVIECVNLKKKNPSCTGCFCRFEKMSVVSHNATDQQQQKRADGGTVWLRYLTGLIGTIKGDWKPALKTTEKWPWIPVPVLFRGMVSSPDMGMAACTGRGPLGRQTQMLLCFSSQELEVVGKWGLFQEVREDAGVSHGVCGRRWSRLFLVRSGSWGGGGSWGGAKESWLGFSDVSVVDLKTSHHDWNRAYSGMQQFHIWIKQVKSSI